MNAAASSPFCSLCVCVCVFLICWWVLLLRQSLFRVLFCVFRVFSPQSFFNFLIAHAMKSLFLQSKRNLHSTHSCQSGCAALTWKPDSLAIAIFIFPWNRSCIGYLACPASRGGGWIYPDNTHGALAIIINVPLDSLFEIELVAIYARLFIVVLPGANP